MPTTPSLGTMLVVVMMMMTTVVTGEVAAAAAVENNDKESVVGNGSTDKLVMVDNNNDDANDPCHESHCQATFQHVYSMPVTIPCSTASGAIPNSQHLPLIYPGDYTACNKYKFAGSHFCTIDTMEFLAYPLRSGVFHYTGEGLPLGKLHIGKCVSTKCTAAHLRTSFLKDVHATARAIQRRMPLALYIPYIEGVIRNSTRVACVDEDEAKMGSVWDRAGSSSFMVLVILLLTMLVACTTYDLLSISYPALSFSRNFAGVDTFARAVSARKSYRSLMSPMSGDFLFLNGVRVLSIIWIIYGHVVLYSSGLALPYPVLNPAQVDSQVQHFQMTIARGAEYSVDTFFFMSGFLATWGTIQESKRHAFTWTTYVRNIVLRYVRLTPAYAFVLFCYYKAMPFISTGPYYHLTQGVDFKNEECKNWWANLLYLNNLYPWGEEGGLRGCMGWSWYLANDFQFFCLVGPAVAYYMWVRARFTNVSTTRWLAMYVIPLLLIVIQLSTTWYVMDRWDIKGSFDPAFNVYLYVKPWCRVSPYAVGMALAFWHSDRVDGDAALHLPEDTWKHKVFYHLPPLAMLVLAFAVTSTIVFSIYDQFRCKAEPSTDCNIWAGFTNFGALVAPNWNHTQLTSYFMFTYGAWACAFAIVCMYFFSGHGGVIRDLFSHQIFTPLARLSYIAYLVHIPILELMFMTAPAPPYVTEVKQYMDAIAITCVAYAVSLVLYFLVERPFMSLTLLNLDHGKKVGGGGGGTVTTTATTIGNGIIPRTSSDIGFEQHVRRVADVDSEVILMASPENHNVSAAAVGGSSGGLTRPLLG